MLDELLPLVSIIIVNFNSEKWVENFSKSINKSSYKKLEIIICDNKSSDKSVNLLRKYLPNATFILNNKNLGFGKASNKAIKRSHGSLLLLLNTDIYFNENFIESIIKYKIKSQSNIVGAKILDFNNYDHYKSSALSIDPYGYLGWGKEPFFLEGSAILLSKKDFYFLGGFDEEFFMYSEDIDLCWRAHLYGFKISISKNSVINHYGGGSSQKTISDYKSTHTVPTFRKYEVEKNNLRAILKNFSIYMLPISLFLFILINFCESLVYLFTNRIDGLYANFNALKWNILNFPNTLSQRSKIQSKRIVNDFYIVSKMNSIIPNKLKSVFLVGLPIFTKKNYEKI